LCCSENVVHLKLSFCVGPPSLYLSFSHRTTLNISSHALAHFDTSDSDRYTGTPTCPPPLCHKKTIIDLNKIKRRICGLNMIWFPVDLYLYQPSFTSRMPSFSVVPTAGNRGRRQHPCCERTGFIYPMFGCFYTCIIDSHHSICIPFPSSVSGPLQLHVSHLFIYYVSVCVSVWV